MGDHRPTKGGLSPRVRRHRISRLPFPSPWRSIAACAASPSLVQGALAVAAVYRRVCGVTMSTEADITLFQGLSPRVRRHLRIPKDLVPAQRSIAACAASPQERKCRSPLDWVYRRVCGVTPETRMERKVVEGLSPRVRRHLLLRLDVRGSDGSIAACAASPGVVSEIEDSHRVYRRVCGVTRFSFLGDSILRGLSPRVRRHLCRKKDCGISVRSIAACAASPTAWSGSMVAGWVYRRVCGVTSLRCAPAT